MATRQKRMYFERLKIAPHYPKLWGDQWWLGKGDPTGRQAEEKEIIVNRGHSFTFQAGGIWLLLGFN